MAPPAALQGSSPTGFYTYHGKPVTEKHLARLRMRGALIPAAPFAPGDAAYDPERWDVFPDNRLKPPYQVKGHAEKKRLQADELFAEEVRELENQQDKRWKVYRRLPEPRPDYFEWAAAFSRRQEYDDTERIARCAEKLSDRLKAKELLLKYGKTLPKQQVELTGQAQELTPLNAAQVLDLALKLHGIPQDKFDEFMRSIRA